MKFDVDDKNRRRLVYVKFHLNRCRFAVAVAECLGAHFFGTQCTFALVSNPPYRSLSFFSFRIHYMDFPDCLLLLLSISVFFTF